MARKYRVMCIDGVLYPLHLAISANWKVHYLSADMATNPGYRAEESRFLEDMPGVLGATGMNALTAIGKMLDLDYVGFDFALAGDPKASPVVGRLRGADKLRSQLTKLVEGFKFNAYEIVSLFAKSSVGYNRKPADVVELVDTPDLMEN